MIREVFRGKDTAGYVCKWTMREKWDENGWRRE